jgi:transposase
MVEGKKRRPRRRFTGEFKAEVVKKVLSSGKTAGQVARDLDLKETAVRAWVKQAQIDKGKGPPGALTTAEKEELARLRKEVRELREDREILKKAAAFSAYRRSSNDGTSSSLAVIQ